MSPLAMKIVGYTLLGLAVLALALKCAVARSHARNEGGGAPVLDVFLGVPLFTWLGLRFLFPHEEHGTFRLLGVVASVAVTVGALVLASWVPSKR